MNPLSIYLLVLVGFVWCQPQPPNSFVHQQIRYQFADSRPVETLSSSSSSSSSLSSSPVYRMYPVDSVPRSFYYSAPSSVNITTKTGGRVSGSRPVWWPVDSANRTGLRNDRGHRPLQPKIRNNRHSPRHIIQARAAKSRYCGRQLVSVLQLVCRGNYNGPSGSAIAPARKRTSNRSFGKVSDQNQSLWTEMEQLQANSRHDEQDDGASPLSRYRRGVVDECCRNPCSILQLQSYCL